MAYKISVNIKDRKTNERIQSLINEIENIPWNISTAKRLTRYPIISRDTSKDSKYILESSLPTPNAIGMFNQPIAN